MTVRRISLAVLPFASAAALALPLVAHGARCPADGRLISTAADTLTKSGTISNQQLPLFAQIFSLQSAGQRVPADLVDRLRSLTNQNRQVLVSGERRLAALPPGTPQGRTFKKLSLRYLREVARPLNECLVGAATAKTVKQLGISIACVDSGRKKGATIQSAINKAMTRLSATGRCTLDASGSR